MPSFRTKRRVHHNAANMFDLVADVESYPAFVPLCEKLVVRSRSDLEQGRLVLIADMTVAYRIFRETFTSKVTLDRVALTVLVEYLDGPFSSLLNRWHFRPNGDRACEVEFHIDYEFRSRALGLLMGSVFDTAFRRFAEAFERRADTVYGRANSARA
jgi:coenzyme Q-binding protein COQ10